MSAAEHETWVAWCGVPSGDGFRGRCVCGWLGKPTPIKAVAHVDCNKHCFAAPSRVLRPPTPEGGNDE